MRVLPSDIVKMIEGSFGKVDLLAVNRIQRHHHANVRTLLSLLDEVPPELIDLNFAEYSELQQCRAVLVSALPMWDRMNNVAASGVGPKDPVELVRRLMEKCRDTVPPPEPEIPFVVDVTARKDIEEK